MKDTKTKKNILISVLIEILDKHEEGNEKSQALMILSRRYQEICEGKISPINRFPEEDGLIEEIISNIEKEIHNYLINNELDECEIRDVIARIEYIYWKRKESE